MWFGHRVDHMGRGDERSMRCGAASSGQMVCHVFDGKMGSVWRNRNVACAPGTRVICCGMWLSHGCLEAGGRRTRVERMVM